MSEPPSQAADAAQAGDDFAVRSHTRYVRVPCIEVNLESVRVPCDTDGMSDKVTIGSRFRDLWQRSGLTQAELARDSGFSHTSGLQRYVSEAHDKLIAVDLAVRFADALAGRGVPPISRAEVMALAGFESGDAARSNATIIEFEGASLEEAPENLQVWGTGLGAAREIDGEAIEQTMLNSGDVVEYVARPAILKRKQVAYALYVQGSSMDPALPEGEMVVACKDMPLKVGDNVVVFLRARDPEFDDGMTARAVLVKRFLRRTANFVELRQYEPAKDFRIDMKEVLRIDRILTRKEMLETR